MVLRPWCVALALALLGAAPARADAAGAQTEKSMRDSHDSLRDPLRQHPFRRPLVLQSAESPEELAGDIHAVLAAPFERVRAALRDPGQWCEVLSLHSNTKYCRASEQPGQAALLLYAGSKAPQSLTSALRMDMAFALTSDTPGLLVVQLGASSGPLGTSDYRVTLAAIPLSEGGTYLHLRYATATGPLARIAMQAYLATAGRGKVGFTRTGGPDDDPPAYLGGARGAIERNTMRYYLAVDAYLASLLTAPAQQLETRLQSWFTATESYPRQLHEMDRQTYLAMKRSEHLRQQSAP